MPTVSNAHSSGLTAEQRLRLAVATFRVLNQTLAENNDTDKSLSEGQYLPCHDANDEGFELVALKLLADPWSAVRVSLFQIHREKYYVNATHKLF